MEFFVIIYVLFAFTCQAWVGLQLSAIAWPNSWLKIISGTALSVFFGGPAMAFLFWKAFIKN